MSWGCLRVIWGRLRKDLELFWGVFWVPRGHFGDTFGRFSGVWGKSWKDQKTWEKQWFFMDFWSLGRVVGLGKQIKIDNRRPGDA